MPGQEKFLMEYYQKNPSAVASLRGTIYEDKIINLIKSKAKTIKKEITKEEAERILKEQNEKELKKVNEADVTKKEVKTKKASITTKSEQSKKKSPKKVSKK
jgi:trigger factor